MALVIMDLRWDTSVEAVEFPIHIHYPSLVIMDLRWDTSVEAVEFPIHCF